MCALQVSSAMGFVVRIPVQEIEDIRYENGRIRFDTEGNTHVSTSDRSTGDRRSSAEFSAADGERFVAAVKARQAALAEAR